MGEIFLNDRFLADDVPCIAPTDRGFIFGDGIYEVIPAYHGQLFRLDAHLERLNNNLDAVRIRRPFTNQQWRDTLNTLVARNQASNPNSDQADNDGLAIYLQVTRGVAPRDHGFPDDVKPTIFAMCNPIKPLADSIREQGIAAIIMDDIRWKYCHIKSIALLPNILLKQQALDQDAQEAILVRDNEVTEGAASNIFVIKNGTISTPPKGELLLPGITRDVILELAAEYNIPHEERPISPDELLTADEIWLSSSTREIVPVTRLDGKPVGAGKYKGKPGPLWQTMSKHFQDYKRSLNLTATNIESGAKNP